MNAFNFFSHALEEHAGRNALVSGIGSKRQQLTFVQLQTRVDHVVVQLVESGLKPGDRVLLAVPVSTETYIVMLALLKAGLVCMVIDPGHGARQMATILRSWPPAAVIGTRSLLLLRLISPELGAIPLRFVVNGSSPGALQLDTAVRSACNVTTVSRRSADSALLTFTSGSTGEPKPVIRTHSFLRQQLTALKPVAQFESGDIDFVAMPMFVLFNLANGVTSIVPACDMKHPGKANPKKIVEQLRTEGATRMVASPALCERLASYCARNRQTLPALRSISTGGGPVRPGLPGLIRRIAPNARIRMVYGSTEAEPIAFIDAEDVSVCAGKQMKSGAGLLVGRPVSGCAVRILASNPGAAPGPLTASAFDSLSLPVGAIGEIVVKGKHVLTTYADPSSNRLTKIAVDDQTWHRTGDAGYFDSDGQLWLVGRCSAAIVDVHGTVFPFQVEYAMSEIKGVRRAALIARDGHRVLALETRGREFSSRCAAAATCIARHNIDRIVVVRRIPLDKRHDTKVDYPALHQVLDGRWSRLRLAMLECITILYRGVRSVLQSTIDHCKSGRAATTVDGCLPKTSSSGLYAKETGESGSGSSLP